MPNTIDTMNEGHTIQDVLCGCGWGQLAIPACDIPELCPQCGFNLWSLDQDHQPPLCLCETIPA